MKSKPVALLLFQAPRDDEPSVVWGRLRPKTHLGPEEEKLRALASSASSSRS